MIFYYSYNFSYKKYAVLLFLLILQQAKADNSFLLKKNKFRKTNCYF